MDIAIDLSAVRDELSKFPAFKEVNKRIGRYAAVNSVARDLEDASASVVSLAAVDQTTGDDRSNFGRPLMTHAVMMYCRATIEDGNGRFKIGSTRNYTKNQLEKHREIVKLRNKSIAHFGIGEGTYGSGWIDERVILQTIDNGADFFIRPVWSRRNYLSQLAFDLLELIPIAEASVAELTKSAGKELMSAVIGLQENKKFQDILRSYRFDPDEFFGNQFSASEFWNRSAFHHEIYAHKDLVDGQLKDTGQSEITPLPPR